MSVKTVPQNNVELRQMAKDALDNWHFDDETDARWGASYQPYGRPVLSTISDRYLY